MTPPPGRRARRGEGGYLLADVDLSEPLPDLRLAPDQDGVGILVRRRRRPLTFVLRAVAPGGVVTAAEIMDLVARQAGSLDPPRPAPPPLPDGPLPALTAAVCTRDRPELLARCVASLVALRGRPWAARVRLEILVVDNAPSDDRTRALIERIPGVRYVHAPVSGLDFARNVALAEARGDFVAFFDDDVRVDPQWIEGFVEAVTANPDAAGVTGPVLPEELATQAQVLFEAYGGFGHRFRKQRYGPTRADDPLYPCHPGQVGAGCNMTLRRAVALALGGFDEALDTGAPLPGGGDLDMFYRLLRAGHTIASEPMCLVFHRHRREYAELRHQMWTWGLGFMAFVAKSYRADPEQRPKFRRMIFRWFRQRTWHSVLCALGRNDRPAGLALAQLAGGAVGLLGEYRRSQRRVRARLAAAPALLPSEEEAS